MKQKVTFLLGICLVTVCLSLLTACARKEAHAESDIAFEELFPNVEMNTKLELALIEGYNSYKIGEDLRLWIRNISKDHIRFPPAWNKRLLVYDQIEKQWSPIQDNRVTLSTKDQLLPPKGAENIEKVQLAEDLVFALPVIPDLSHSIVVRVVVVGQIVEEEQPTGVEVGAYLDVTLQP